jgi:hypothetical protein
VIGRANHAFSVVMSSDEYLRNLYLKDESNGVLFEGFLGSLKGIRFVEDLMLEIKGENGTIRIDVDKDKVIKALTKSPSP